MADEGEKAKEAGGEAAGLTLASLGGFTVLKELHVLEHGEFHFDSLVHTELGGGATRTEVSDRGVELNCKTDLAITHFRESSSGAIEPDLRQPAPIGKEAAGPALTAQVLKVAQQIDAQWPVGEVLVLGSTDPLSFHDKTAGDNAALAKARAEQVAALLRKDLGGAAPRQVTVANDRLGGGDPQTGLARLLFGGKEAADRSVAVCLMEPRAPSVTVSAAAASPHGGLTFLGGLSAGLAIALVLTLIAVILGEGVWGWLKEKLKA
jgi:hypothetical protein